jgi:hypothetical protein
MPGYGFACILDMQEVGEEEASIEFCERISNGDRSK